MVGCCKLSLYANGLVMSIISGIEAYEFLCIYTRVQPAIADVFPVGANTRTKSIQKQIKSRYPEEYSTSIK